VIGDVRGKGLMVGVELVKDPSTKEPAVEEAARVFETARDNGVIMGKGGIFGNVLRINPPMCLGKEDVLFFSDVMEESLSRL
jgi:alanine-glyoxylate transaminase/(R)-3-amino-2-methylpropionate-pyruvate transaminase